MAGERRVNCRRESVARRAAQQNTQAAARQINHRARRNRHSRRGGSKEEAQVYYARIGRLLGLDIEKTTLGSILQFYGYSTISATKIEALDSFDLMPRNDTEFDRLASLVTDSAASKREFTLADFTGGQVLVSRFFAPKIVNFNDMSGTGGNTFVAGWRKLVRLQPRANSSAAGRSLGPMYVLFNYFEKDPKTHPLGTNNLRTTR